jgi:hypothetical protein
MPMPAIEFLLEASKASLEDLELASLNRSANLSKILKRELDAWVEQLASAIVARWMMENREIIIREVLGAVEIKPKKVELFDFGEAKKSA